jgi:hypothetical protein
LSIVAQFFFHADMSEPAKSVPMKMLAAASSLSIKPSRLQLDDPTKFRFGVKSSRARRGLITSA